jgi:hypothetical protein
MVNVPSPWSEEEASISIKRFQPTAEKRGGSTGALAFGRGGRI